MTDPHPLEQLRAFLLDQVMPRLRVLVAQDDSGIVGFLAATEDSVGQPDVPVGRIGGGIGSALLRPAQEQSSGQLWPYTLARDHSVLAFYTRHGFVEVARGFEPVWSRLGNPRTSGWSGPEGGQEDPQSRVFASAAGN